MEFLHSMRGGNQTNLAQPVMISLRINDPHVKPHSLYKTAVAAQTCSDTCRNCWGGIPIRKSCSKSHQYQAVQQPKKAWKTRGLLRSYHRCHSTHHRRLWLAYVSPFRDQSESWSPDLPCHVHPRTDPRAESSAWTLDRLTHVSAKHTFSSVLKVDCEGQAREGYIAHETRRRCSSL